MIDWLDCSKTGPDGLAVGAFSFKVIIPMSYSRIFHPFLLASFLVATVSNAAAQFADVINADLRVVWSSADGQHVVVGGADSALRVSADAGLSWRPVGPGKLFEVEQLVGDGQGGLLAAGTEGLLRSADQGEHWEAARLPAGRVAGWPVYDTARHIWLAPCAQGGLLVSRDGGRSWSLAEGAPMLATVLVSVDADGSVLVAGDDGRLYLSADLRRWRALEASAGAPVVRFLALGKEGTLVFRADGGVARMASGKLGELAPIGARGPASVFHDAARGRIYAGSPTGEFWRSDDDGKSWQRSVVLENIFLTGIQVDPRDGALTVVGGRGTVARSEDGGHSWSIVRGNAWTSRLLGVAASADGRRLYAVGTGGMLIRSEDRGRKWSIVQDDLKHYVNELAGMADGGLLAAGTDGLLMRSNDAGLHWSPVQMTQPTDVSILSLAAGPQGSMLASGPMSSFLRSNDGGRRWQVQQPVADAGEGYFRQVLADRAGKTLLLVGSPGRVMRSVDGGLSWQRSYVPAGDERIVAAASAGEGVFLFLCNDGRLFGSVDAGVSWKTLAQFGMAPAGLYIDESGRDVWVMAPGRIFVSHDAGQAWDMIETPAMTPGWMMRTHAGSLLAFGNDGAIMRSADGGQRWNRVPSGVRSSLRKPLESPDGHSIYVPGRDGTLLMSNDDGTSWQSLFTGTKAHINRLWLSADGKVLLVSGERIVRIRMP